MEFSFGPLGSLVALLNSSRGVGEEHEIVGEDVQDEFTVLG
jgi:hypothetical protein